MSFYNKIMYHGTISTYENNFKYIDFSKTRKHLDFGPGFYLTSNWYQAGELACKRVSHWFRDTKELVKPIILKYEVDWEGLKTCSYLELLEENYEWGEFIFNNRIGNLDLISSFHNLNCKFDSVYGMVAGEGITNGTELLKNNKITIKEFSEMIKPKYNKVDNVVDQLSIHSKEAEKFINLLGIDN